MPPTLREQERASAAALAVLVLARLVYTDAVAAQALFDAKLALDEDSIYCPVRATLALLGLKWVPRIIYELMQGKRRFNELACAVGGCNSRTLRDRLKGLEELGIIERNVIAVMPPWVEYELTAKGHELGGALRQIEAWGRSNMADPAV